MKTNTNYSYRELLVDAWRLMRPYRKHFLFGTFFRISTDLLGLYTTYTMTRALAFFAGYTIGDSAKDFWILILLWGIAYTVVIIFRQIAKYLCYLVAERMQIDVQLQAIQHLSKLDLAWHEQENTGNKLKRAQKGGEGWHKLIKIWVDNFIRGIVDLIGITVILAVVDWRVGVILLVFFITYLLISLPLLRGGSRAAKLVNQSEEDLSGLMFETVNNIRTVKLMNIYPRLYPRLQSQATIVAKKIKTRVTWFRSKSAVQGLWASSFRLGISALIGYGIINGRYEVAFLLLFNFYFATLRESIEELADISQEIIISKYNISRIKAIFDTPVNIDSDENKVNFPSNWKIITLRNLSFAYGKREVLKNVNFAIKRGDRIGVVGLSGAGKSTLFKLLLKEYEDYTGEILVDDVPLKNIKKTDYFEHVSVVPQETEVFNFTLRDNITLASAEGKNENARLKRALSIAHITDFMSKLSDGVETFIGEKGVRLSGGEKQRVGIARAVYKNPSIIFMDEATSHLDSESEEKIKDAMHQVFQEVTALVIAHRLSTIQEMDTILLFENGELAEAGTFKELQKKRGRFFDLWEKQRL